MLRDDLTFGQALAQTIHAVRELGPLAGPPTPHEHALALHATALELAKLEAKLLAEGIPHVAIREPDPPFNGALVALGIVPGLPRVRRLCKHLRKASER